MYSLRLYLISNGLLSLDLTALLGRDMASGHGVVPPGQMTGKYRNLADEGMKWFFMRREDFEHGSGDVYGEQLFQDRLNRHHRTSPLRSLF